MYINNTYIYIPIYSKQWCHLSFTSLTCPIGLWAIRILAVSAVVQCCFELDFFKFYFWFHFVFYFLHVLGRQISDKLKMFSGSPCFTVFRQLFCGYQFSDIICFYFIWITWGWKACTLTTIIKYQKIISTVYTEVIKQNTQKSDCLRFSSVKYKLLTIWYGIVSLTLNKKKLEEFCLK